MITGGAVFVGSVPIVVYVGSVLIFSLSVTMMLDLRVESKSNLDSFLLIMLALGALLSIDVAVSMHSGGVPVDFEFLRVLHSQPNIVVIGYVLYSWYAIPLILCALILLVAMIGTIVLLLSVDPSYVGEVEQSVCSQNISTQVTMQDFEIMELRSINICYEDSVQNVRRLSPVGMHVPDIVPDKEKLALTIEAEFGIVLLPHPRYLDTTKWVLCRISLDGTKVNMDNMELPPTVNGKDGMMTLLCPGCWDLEMWIQYRTIRISTHEMELEIPPVVEEGRYGTFIVPGVSSSELFEWPEFVGLIKRTKVSGE
jgi:NADH:ubiquinone oxidoreductase subunit 6 (subunit J)